MRLGVNIDHVASVREIRHGTNPEPVFAAMICEANGADSIVVHLREDRRHIKENDVFLLKKAVKTKLNLEMSIAAEIVDIACKLKPEQVTLVPERRREITTEGGLDVVKNLKKIQRVCERLTKEGVAVSLFIDPEKKQIDAAYVSKAKMIELHTGRYANAKDKNEQEEYLKELKVATGYAKEKGLRVFAGHGLDYNNVIELPKIKGIEELNIGYAIICRAVLVGLDRAVREMKVLIK